MAETNQSLQVFTISTSPTSLLALNTFSVFNSSADALLVSVDGGTNTISLSTNQSLSLESATGFILPTIILSGTNIEAQVVTS
tara:strand:- start:295 stop:543 length:249 start_codon:yes stop_codon:yes gene_type:complete